MEILSQFLESYARALIMNGFFITLFYFIFWKLFKNKFKNYRIQIKERVDSKQLKREIINAFGVLFVGVFFSVIVYYLSTKGYTKIYTNYSDHSPFYVFAGFFILLIIDDTWFYWMHRLIHHPKIYKYIHAVHHKSIDINPFSSISFHALEPFLLTSWIFPVAFFIPTYAPVLGILQLYALLHNIKTHLGYEFYPSNFNKGWLKFLTASTHHNMHHSKFNGNYGIHFRFWDRLCDTEFSNYETEFSTIKNRNNNIDIPENNNNLIAVANVLLSYGGLYQVGVNKNETILESILRENINVPYACKRGNCGTCKCQLTKGEVETKPSRAITEEEIDNGLILICQSKPISENIEITVLN